MPPQGAPAPGLAFKAREIEEYVDVYFYRRLGWVAAYVARGLRLTPNAVSVLGGVAGVMGGALLYDRRLGLAGCAFLVLYGILDSADGQLARMTGKTSHLGRVLDGVAGYATHVAIYLAIVAGVVDRGGTWWWVLGWACLAGMSNVLQAQMYDYYRSIYARVVVYGDVANDPIDRIAGGPFGFVAAKYLRLQRGLIGRHAAVERALAARASGAVVGDEDRQLYRAHFRKRVRGWNLLGDNARRFAVGALVLVQRVEWFCAFVLIPMSIAFAALWYWQRLADGRFLDALEAPRVTAA